MLGFSPILRGVIIVIENYLEYIVKDIHSVVIASIDDNYRPITCAIDIMDYDDSNLYFLTAKGKNFYERIKSNPHISFTGIKGKDTLNSIAVSVQGEVREVGTEYLSTIFKKNSYMEQIYPTLQSQTALTVFQIYRGIGEVFDLSKKPIARFNFSFGKTEKKQHGYFVNDKCIGCKICYSKCPQKCIDCKTTPVSIQQEHCLHCGNCYETCPLKAIERR